MDLQNKVANLEAKVETLIDLISNKPELQSDSVKIKDFIEKYSILQKLLEDETLVSITEKLNALNDTMQEIRNEIEGPLLVAKEQSERLLKIYSDDTTGLALNIADVKLLKEDLYKSIKDFTKYIQSLDIDTKLNTLKEQVALSKALNQEIIAQKSQIDKLLKRIEKDEAIINSIQEVNKEQTDLINQVNDLVVILEKQIEDYAFFTNEFNKIYISAKEFMTRFSEALTTLEFITKRDEILYNFVKKTASLLESDYTTLTTEIKALRSQIQQTLKEMLSWLNHSLMFVNEVRAYNLSLRAYNTQMENIEKRAEDVIAKLETISL